LNLGLILGSAWRRWRSTDRLPLGSIATDPSVIPRKAAPHGLAEV